MKQFKIHLATAPIAVALALLILLLATLSVYAQDNISVDKQLGRSNPVVYVGEYITFTIEIVNNTTFTVTTLPLSDTFNNAVLQYVDASPVSPDRLVGSNRLEWDDLTNSFGNLAPGQHIDLVVGFIAAHPAEAIVNEAEVHDAMSYEQELGGSNGGDGSGESVGGSSPVDKEVLGGSYHPAGLPITFTITISNDGYAQMVTVPLVDTYDPAGLTFSHAIPQPDLIQSGTLTWYDASQGAGIPPHGSLVVTAVFTALVPLSNTLNQAEVAGARDEYGNDLGAGHDQVPITIIQQPTGTPNPSPTPTNPPPPPPPPATSTPRPPDTPTPTKSPPTPVFLPESGQGSSGDLLLPAATLIAVLGLILYAWIRRS